MEIRFMQDYLLLVECHGHTAAFDDVWPTPL